MFAHFTTLHHKLSPVNTRTALRFPDIVDNVSYVIWSGKINLKSLIAPPPQPPPPKNEQNHVKLCNQYLVSTYPKTAICYVMGCDIYKHNDVPTSCPTWYTRTVLERWTLLLKAKHSRRTSQYHGCWCHIPSAATTSTAMILNNLEQTNPCLPQLTISTTCTTLWQSNDLKCKNNCVYHKNIQHLRR